MGTIETTGDRESDSGKQDSLLTEVAWGNPETVRPWISCVDLGELPGSPDLSEPDMRQHG